MINLIGILFFILGLGLIVLVHEFGHLIMAKRNGVYCHEYSIGMGPKIKTIYVDKTGTVYNLRAIPLGGYVSLAGENPSIEKETELRDDQKFANKTKWQKFKILIAGSVMNFILAYILIFLVLFFNGSPELNTNKITVAPNTPIASAGIQTGDKIVEVNSNRTNNYNEITEELSNSSDKVSLKIDHNSEIKNYNITKKDNIIGISPYNVKYRPILTIKSSAVSFKNMAMNMYISITSLITGSYTDANGNSQEVGINDLSGPVGIASYSVNILQLGFMYFVLFIAFLSVNIGLMNLLPIPALDGGRILFLGIELIIRRKIPQKIEDNINIIFFFILIGLILFVTGNDIIKLIGG